MLHRLTDVLLGKQTSDSKFQSANERTGWSLNFANPQDNKRMKTPVALAAKAGRHRLNRVCRVFIFQLMIPPIKIYKNLIKCHPTVKIFGFEIERRLLIILRFVFNILPIR